MGWPFTILYIALIIAFAYLAFSVIPKALKTNSWPEAQATVTDTSIVKRIHTNKFGKRITVHSAKLAYQYTVDDTEFNTHKFKWADKSPEGKKVQHYIANTYPNNATFPVYYNPEKPSETTLTRGMESFYLVGGIILLALITWLTILLFRKI